MSETSNSDICKYCNKKDFPCEDYCPWRTCSARNLCEKQHQEKTMTEEKKTPTFIEIIGSFNEKCHCDYDNDYETEDCRPCDYCKILYPDYESRECYQNGAWTPGCSGCSDSQGECLNYYIYDVATGKRPLDKPLWNPPPPKAELPSWCNVGEWVMDDGELTHINEIDNAYIWGKVADRDVTMMQPVDRARELKPVKFRPYTFEEAKALIGKTVVVETDGFIVEILIYNAKFIKESSTVLINYADFATWQSDNATIDGVPIGVPVVDEELLSNP